MQKQTRKVLPQHSSFELSAEGDVDEEVDAAVDDEAEVAGGQQHVQPVGELGTHSQGVLGGRGRKDKGKIMKSVFCVGKAYKIKRSG